MESKKYTLSFVIITQFILKVRNSTVVSTVLINVIYFRNFQKESAVAGNDTLHGCTDFLPNTCHIVIMSEQYTVSKWITNSRSSIRRIRFSKCCDRWKLKIVFHVLQKSVVVVAQNVYRLRARNRAYACSKTSTSLIRDSPDMQQAVVQFAMYRIYFRSEFLEIW